MKILNKIIEDVTSELSTTKLKNIIKKDAFNLDFDYDMKEKDYVYKNMLVSKLKPTQSFGTEGGKEKINKIKRSVIKDGFKIPIIVDENNNVINGNHRLEVALLLGIKYIPTLKMIGDGNMKILKEF